MNLIGRLNIYIELMQQDNERLKRRRRWSGNINDVNAQNGRIRSKHPWIARNFRSWLFYHGEWNGLFQQVYTFSALADSLYNENNNSSSNHDLDVQIARLRFSSISKNIFTA